MPRVSYNLGEYRLRYRGEYVPTNLYTYMDWVTCDGGSYTVINQDCTDESGLIGVHPTDSEDSELYWAALAVKGSTGDGPEIYQRFGTVSNGLWDFSTTDKIIVPSNGNSVITLENVYDGCCGIIISDLDLSFPNNPSLYSVDYDYIIPQANEFYIYSFVCATFGSNLKLIWNRAVYYND